MTDFFGLTERGVAAARLTGCVINFSFFIKDKEIYV